MPAVFPAWAVPAEDVLRHYSVSLDKGLSEEEVAER
jgi:hypothetical protein